MAITRSYKFTVWDQPKPLARPRFARLPNGKVHSYLPQRDQEVRFNIRKAWLELGAHDLVGPLRLEVEAWLPMPVSIAKKRRATALPGIRPDLDNYIKQVEDGLSGYAFRDDAQIVSIVARKRYVNPDSQDKPRWEIQLDELDGGQ